MSWMPKTLMDALNDEDPEALAVETVNKKGATQPLYRCECGQAVESARIVDTRALPIPESWACDGCWTKWQRNKRVIDGGAPFSKRYEWRERWMIANKAPAKEITKIKALRKTRSG